MFSPKIDDYALSESSSKLLNDELDVSTWIAKGYYDTVAEKRLS